MNRTPTSLASSTTHPWVYAPLVTVTLLFIFIGVTSNNTAFFLVLNRLSLFTGDAVWAHLTVLGDTLIALTLLLAFAGRRPDIIWAGAIAALLSALWVHGLKGPLDIPRPPAVLTEDLLHIIGPVLKKNSFPSGHTTTIFTLAAVLCLQLRSTAWCSAILFVAVLAGLSRAAVGVHWPLDILAGAFGGWFSGIAGTLLAQRVRWGMTMTGQWLLSAVLVACAFTVLLRPDPIYAQTQVFQWVLATTCLLIGASGLWKRFRTHR